MVKPEKTYKWKVTRECFLESMNRGAIRSVGLSSDGCIYASFNLDFETRGEMDFDF